VVQIGKFYPPQVGGIEMHLQALCGELRKTHDVRVIVANHRRYDEQGVFDGVAVTRLASHFSLAGVPFCASMPSLIRRSKADIVHIHLPNPMGVAAYLASGRRGCLIATWHSDVVRQKTLARIFAPLERRFLRECRALIATSPNYLHSSAILSQHHARCAVIPYGIPLDCFNAGEDESAAIRVRYGPRIALTVGRLVYYKGIEHLIEAMTQVNATLLIIGDGPLRLQLERRARKAGVGERVVFIGEMSNDRLAPYYKACDLFVLPSIARSEAFGIVQLEAMACGKPVINTSLTSGVPFVSLDGVTGITVPPAAPGALAGAMNRLFDNCELAARYGRAAKERVHAEFSLSRMVDRTLDLYDEVMHSGEAESL
jgi:glycosyltransferase involved in cell wall biosynthesis